LLRGLDCCGDQRLEGPSNDASSPNAAVLMQAGPDLVRAAGEIAVTAQWRGALNCA
jgi:hypothetical protein